MKNITLELIYRIVDCSKILKAKQILFRSDYKNHFINIDKECLVFDNQKHWSYLHDQGQVLSEDYIVLDDEELHSLKLHAVFYYFQSRTTERVEAILITGRYNVIIQVYVRGDVDGTLIPSNYKDISINYVISNFIMSLYTGQTTILTLQKFINEKQ